jgi:hypothetical protein
MAGPLSDEQFLEMLPSGELRNLWIPPTFSDVEEHRKYLKERLVLAIRIFAKYGFDHHIVSSVSRLLRIRSMPRLEVTHSLTHWKGWSSFGSGSW